MDPRERLSPTMIERKRWESGQAPAVRRGDLGEPFVCYFCGDKTAIRSYGDDRDDNGVDRHVIP